MSWTQQCEEKGWKTEIGKAWGISSIPRLFVLNQKGKIHTIDARGRVEKIIEELLKK